MAGEAKQPDWITGEALEWPRHRYVTGVGVAEDRATSEDRARAEISRVFVTRVVSTTSAYSSEATRTDRVGSLTLREGMVSDDTRTATSKELVGVEIAASWQDPTSRQHYSLAILDRDTARRRLLELVAALDAEAASSMVALRSEDRVMSALAAIQLKRLARAQDPLIADLRIVAPRYGETPQVQALKQELGRVLGRVRLRVTVSGDVDKVIEAGVLKGLAAAGLTGAGADAAVEPDLEVPVEVVREDLGTSDGWKWARSSVTLSVRAVASKQVLVQLYETDRQASQTAAEAARRSLKGVSDRVVAGIPAKLESWAQPGH
jgi:hypothetical protein